MTGFGCFLLIFLLDISFGGQFYEDCLSGANLLALMTTAVDSIGALRALRSPPQSHYNRAYIHRSLPQQPRPLLTLPSPLGPAVAPPGIHHVGKLAQSLHTRSRRMPFVFVRRTPFPIDFSDPQ